MRKNATMKLVNVRVPESLWRQARTKTVRMRTNMTKLITACLRAYVAGDLALSTEHRDE